MSARLALALWLMSPLQAFAVDCPEATTAAALNDQLDDAEDAYRSVNLDDFTLALDSSVLLLPCMGEPLSKGVAARFHRMQGMGQVIGRDPDAARRSFEAARRADPTYIWPDSLIPPGHVIRTTYDEAEPQIDKDAEIPPPESGAILLDGVAREARPTLSPTIFQWIGDDGTVKITQIVRVGAGLPDYAQAVVAAPEPEPETPEPEPVGPEEPVVSRSGSIVVPAAVTGGAVALGAGSLGVFFGQTRAHYNSYLSLREEGRYSDAGEVFETKVVPSRTVSQVLAITSVTALGVGGYLWVSSTATVQPTLNGVRISGRF